MKRAVLLLAFLAQIVACGSDEPIYPLEGESCEITCSYEACDRTCDGNVMYRCSTEGVYEVLEDCDLSDASCVMYTSGGDPESGPTGPPLTVECSE